MISIQEMTKISDFEWEIPKSFRNDMRVPVKLFATRQLLEEVMKDRSIEQAINSTTLPGLVGHVLVIQVNLINLLAFLYDNTARDAHDRAVGRHLFDDDGIGPYSAVLTHFKGAKDLGAGSYHNVVSKCRMPLLLLEAHSSQRDPLVKGDVLAYLSGFTDDHAHPMIDEKTLSSAHGRMDLNAGEHPCEVGNQARDSVKL